MSDRRPGGLSAPQQALVTAALPQVERLARRIARRYPHVPLNVISSAGSLALVLAALAYDPAKNDAFVGFWWKRARGAMIDAVRAATRDAARSTPSAGGLRGGLAASEGLRDETSVFHSTEEDLDRHVIESCDLVALGFVSGVAGPALLAEGEQSLIALLDRARDLNELTALLAALPDEDRQIVHLRFIEERPVQEVADLRGVCKATVERHCVRITARLHAILTARGIGGAPTSAGQPRRIEVSDSREAPSPALR